MVVVSIRVSPVLTTRGTTKAHEVATEAVDVAVNAKTTPATVAQEFRTTSARQQPVADVEILTCKSATGVTNKEVVTPFFMLC